MKCQIFRSIGWPVFLSLLAVTLLPTGTAPTAANGPLPDKFLFSIGAQAPVGQFNWPSGVAVAPDGVVYVADSENHRIQRFSATGDFLGKWGSEGSGNGQFRNPYGVAVAPDGTVYVAGLGNNRIQHFSATGTFLGKWGSQGFGDGQFAWPHGVAVAPNGTVYVADTDNNRIQCFSASGDFLGKWGSQGSGDEQFTWPSGVAAAPDGTAYVADTENHRIQAFGPTYPAVWRGEYFANRWLTERPLVITQTAEVNFDWDTGAPDPVLPADGFSARFQRYVWFDAGIYRFTVQAEGGARLWVNGRLLVDQWDGPAGTHSATLLLTAGDHPLRLEYNDISGPAAVHLAWEILELPHRVYLPLVMKGYLMQVS
jgi:tripartite motif-containing protein 71